MPSTLESPNLQPHTRTTPEEQLAALFGRLLGARADRIRAGDLTLDWHTLAVDLTHWAKAAERCDRGEGDMAFRELLGMAAVRPVVPSKALQPAPLYTDKAEAA